MWQLDNRTPFAAERGWVRDRNGAEIWLVAVKCTFDIKPDGSTVVSDDQPPVLQIPEYTGEPGKSSLRYESDLVLTKKTTDILLLGQAHAPGGKAVTELDIGFRVGTIVKRLRVFGDRSAGWASAGSPQPFTKMPLVYERAFGGVDRQSNHPERDWEWRNPVGTGFAVKKAHLDDVPLPNIEHPDHVMRAWDDRPPPAGFGPIGCHWQPRAGFAGTYGDRWLKERQPLLPEDFDDRFFQCAPQDQQAPEFLQGGESVTLLNVTPSGELRFILPKVFLRFETCYTTGGGEIHDNRRLHTVILEPDFPRVSLVWHTALPCHYKVHKLDRTIITQKPYVTQGGETAEHTLTETA